MALKGLILTTWIGWLSGTIVLRRPWGPPSFTSWLTFSTIYSLTLLVMYCFLIVDSLYNNSQSMYMDETHRFGKWVTAFALIQYAVCTLLQRLVLIVKAKKLGNLMYILSAHQPDQNKRKRITLESLLIYSCFLSTLVMSASTGSGFVISNFDSVSWLNELGLGRWGYAWFYSLFVLIPLAVVSNCAFAVVLVISLRVTEHLCDFCNQVRKALLKITADSQNKIEIFNILHQRSKFGEKDRRDSITELSVKFTRQEIIDQFEELKEIFRLADNAVSPVAFLVIVGMTLNLVATASQIFIIGHSGLPLFSDIMKLIMFVQHCALLQVGHQIHKMQRRAKTNLNMEFMNLSWTPEKSEIEDVIESIVEWEWKLSGCGFFYVDRRLASGIFSLVLNYVVICVQLNIALEDPQPSCVNSTRSR